MLAKSTLHVWLITPGVLLCLLCGALLCCCSFEVTCSSSSIPAGTEITISYGSNKSNLALQSCYGFFVPGNPNDAQLLQPIFNSCLAAADGIQGFDAELVAAAAAVERQQQQPQQQQLKQAVELQLARRKCAVDALPIAPSAPDSGRSSSKSDKTSLQLQSYLAELILYQIRLIMQLCGTTAADDAAALGHLRGSCSSAASSAANGSIGSAPSGQQRDVDAELCCSILSLRLEQKLLLEECRDVCTRLRACIGEQLESLASR